MKSDFENELCDHETLDNILMRIDDDRVQLYK